MLHLVCTKEVGLIRWNSLNLLLLPSTLLIFSFSHLSRSHAFLSFPLWFLPLPFSQHRCTPAIITQTVHLWGRSISFNSFLTPKPPKKHNLDLSPRIPPWPQNSPHFQRPAPTRCKLLERVASAVEHTCAQHTHKWWQRQWRLSFQWNNNTDCCCCDDWSERIINVSVCHLPLPSVCVCADTLLLQ